MAALKLTKKEFKKKAKEIAEQDKQQNQPEKRPPVKSSSNCTNISLVKSSVIGIVLTGLIYLVISPFKDSYIGRLFLNPDSLTITVALSFLFSWSVAIVAFKALKVKMQKRAMDLDLLPRDISKRIGVSNIEAFYMHIKKLGLRSTDSFLVNRILRGLEHFSVLRKSTEVGERMSTQSDIDALAVESSYTMIKVFIWAIPILGFIGTVMGISDAVSGFSGEMSGAGDIAALKEKIGAVTGGLGVAFDTTLVALVMSLIAMILSSAMQKMEDDILNRVDEYTNDNFLKRLVDETDKSNANISANENQMNSNEDVVELMTQIKRMQKEMFQFQLNNTEFYKQSQDMMARTMKQIQSSGDKNERKEAKKKTVLNTEN